MQAYMKKMQARITEKSNKNSGKYDNQSANFGFSDKLAYLGLEVEYLDESRFRAVHSNLIDLIRSMIRDIENLQSKYESIDENQSDDLLSNSKLQWYQKHIINPLFIGK